MNTLNKIRARAQSESGFALVELLVVMLIVGLLAGIAVPALMGQRDKADDAEAKAAVRTAQIAIEVFASDNGNEYEDADRAALHAIEPTLLASGPYAPTISYPSGALYQVTVASRGAPNTFTITRHGDGTKTRTCTVAGSGGCRADGAWG